MLSPAQLLNGYARGAFPMAESADDDHLHWFDPPMRGILPIGGVHASRSLRRELRRGDWSAHIDCDFGGIVAACADRDTTWINGPLVNLYQALHAAGHAHAIEIRSNGRFAGGMFGVTIGGAFFGESMVSEQKNGSRMALLWASAHLERCGFTLFDTQFLTPHLASMGGVEISRAVYRQRLVAALQLKVDFRSRNLLCSDSLSELIDQNGG